MHMQRLMILYKESESDEQRASLLREVAANREHLYVDYKKGMLPSGAWWEVELCLKCRAFMFYESSTTSARGDYVPAKRKYRLPGLKALLGPFGWSETEPECMVHPKSVFSPEQIERFILDSTKKDPR